MAKRRITWTKNGTPFFGGIDSPDAPHGGRDDLHFVIRKNKRGYSVEDAPNRVEIHMTRLGKRLAELRA